VTSRIPVSARMLALSAALLEALSPNSRAPASRPDAPHSPPARGRVRGGGQVVHLCGQHLNAHGHAIRTADEMHAPSNERLPFGSALPTAFAPAHLNRQNLGVGNVRSHITVMPQAFHQRVNHDESGYHPRGVHRLLLAMMLVGQPQSCQRCRWSSTSNQGMLCQRALPSSSTSDPAPMARPFRSKAMMSPGFRSNSPVAAMETVEVSKVVPGACDNIHIEAYGSAGAPIFDILDLNGLEIVDGAESVGGRRIATLSRTDPVAALPAPETRWNALMASGVSGCIRQRPDPRRNSLSGFERQAGRWIA